MTTIQEYRGKSTGDLQLIARGTNAFGAPLDPMPTPDQITVAQAQLELRNRGQQLVHGVLHAHGLKYSGTGGWHIVPMVSTDGYLGWTNIADGTACLTDVQVPDDVIEACTVPDQGAGVKASGAAAWSTPDAGLAVPVITERPMPPTHVTGDITSEKISVMSLRPPTAEERPTAPDGWTQLLLDVRDFHGGACSEPTPCRITRYVVGLRTCYGSIAWPERIGAPIGLRTPGLWEYTDPDRADTLVTDALHACAEIIGPPPSDDEVERTFPMTDQFAERLGLESDSPIKIGIEPYFAALSDAAKDKLDHQALHETGTGGAFRICRSRAAWRIYQTILPALDAIYPHLPRYNSDGQWIDHHGYMEREWDRKRAREALVDIEAGRIRQEVAPILTQLADDLLPLLATNQAPRLAHYKE